MHKPVPSAKQLDQAAFLCAVTLAICMAGAIIDGADGVSRLKRSTYRLADDPVGFRGALIIQWGLPAILSGVCGIAFGVGALVLKGPGKASTDE